MYVVGVGGWYTGGDVDGYWGTVCEGLLLCSYYKMEACPWDQTRKHCILTGHLLHLESTKYAKVTSSQILPTQ